MEKLAFLGMRGDARLYEFTGISGLSRRIVISGAEVAVAGCVVEPLRYAVAKARLLERV